MREALREMLDEAGPALIDLCGVGIFVCCTFILLLVLA